MDNQTIIHDLKESNLKMKILIQMIANSINSGHSKELDEKVNQLIEELESTKVTLRFID